MIMERKYFFFDVDGTLLLGPPGNQYIPESTKLALNKLREKGHFLAIATGRSHAMAQQIMRELGFENVVSDGGNGITVNGKLLGIKPLNYGKCLKLIDECERKGFVWAFSPDNESRRLAPNNRFYNMTHDLYMRTDVIEGLNPRDYDKIYKVYVVCETPDEEQLESLKELPWCRYHKEYLYVEPDNKSVGIRSMIDYLGGDYSDVVVFGDGKNDLSMFCDEWTSIAMGNAVDILKQKATYVTDDIDKDGIMKACVHFNWI